LQKGAVPIAKIISRNAAFTESQYIDHPKSTIAPRRATIGVDNNCNSYLDDVLIEEDVNNIHQLLIKSQHEINKRALLFP
jgi:hypothetical protein